MICKIPRFRVKLSDYISLFDCGVIPPETQNYIIMPCRAIDINERYIEFAANAKNIATIKKTCHGIEFFPGSSKFTITDFPQRADFSNVRAVRIELTSDEENEGNIIMSVTQIYHHRTSLLNLYDRAEYSAHINAIARICAARSLPLEIFCEILSYVPVIRVENFFGNKSALCNYFEQN